MRYFALKGTLFTVIAVCALAGCGGDSSSGVSSGVDPAKTANTATADDARKVCSAIANYTASQLNATLIRRTVCVQLTAVPALSGNAPTVPECNDSVNRCQQSGGTTSGQTTSGQTARTPIACTGMAIPTNCTATVGQIEACATAIVDSTRDYFNGLTCDLWGLPPADAQARIRATPATPAACTAVQQSCPGLLSSN